MKTDNIVILLLLSVLLTACSMTKNIPEDEQLFTGVKKIAYADEDSLLSTFQNSAPGTPSSKVIAQHLSTTKEEVDAALATVPNGSLFGSSKYTVPWSWHLWVYNKYSQKQSKFARWMAKSFGKPPVLMSQVNPALRASVARSVLRNNGFFRGDVTYEAVPQKNPKKSKISYTIRLDSLFTFDSIAYVGFPDSSRMLIDSTAAEATIRRGDPFTVSALENERTRIANLFRNNGYYYYNTSYASYFADTIAVDNRVQLRFQLADALPEETMRKWYMGTTTIQFRQTMREQLTDSLIRRSTRFYFSGKNPPVRPRVVLKDLKLRPRQEFSYAKYLESANKLNATGMFSSMDFQFTPRPVAHDSVVAHASARDSLDMTINCVFDKPYDFYFEVSAVGRTIGRYGPEAKVGFVKRNAFKGGEKLDINLHGSNEWQPGNGRGGNRNTYQYGADASIEFPRIIAPFYNSDRRRIDKQTGRPKPRRFYATPTTLAKASFDIINRPDYYRTHVAGGEWTYRWQTSEQSRHEFSPLTLKYQRMNTSTEQFDSILSENPYLSVAMGNYFIPKMRYTYTYTSPSTYRNPIRWETTFEESGNLVAFWDVLGGHGWNEKGKTLFKNNYSQFVKVETDFTKTWSVGSASSLVAHLNAGMIYYYGNSNDVPFSEMFYAGGANSIRAFKVRGVGPGGFSLTALGVQNRQFTYVMQNGDMKLVANLEYRPRLFGNLEGALFIDAGNVWLREMTIPTNDEIIDMGIPADQADLYRVTLEKLFTPMIFHTSTFLKQIAVGTGIGLRYDLGFLAIRLDWGFALHMPYDTGRSGYFNVNRFSDAQTLHFAVGYPF